MDITELELDGEAFLAARVEALAEIVRAGGDALVVFDLDNTLFDTRPRTLAAARSFDATHGTTWFVDLALDGVRRDGRAMGSHLPPQIAEAFARHWEAVFFDPASLALDLPLDPIVRWVHAADARGIGVRYLTGRIARFAEASRAALLRAGLPAGPEAVVCKRDLSVRTEPFKTAALRAWAAEATLGWFMTEAVRDIAAIRRELPELPCVWLDCSFEVPDETVARTPRLPRCF